MRLVEKYERFGLIIFKKDYLIQYLFYLRGYQCELELGDFYQAKRHYLESLTKTVYVNHRIRKLALERLMSINQRIGFPPDNPEKRLYSRYLVKQKYVQIILDTASFSNRKVLESTVYLIRNVFESLNDQDWFGLRILKNGFKVEQSRSERMKVYQHQRQALNNSTDPQEEYDEES